MGPIEHGIQTQFWLGPVALRFKVAWRDQHKVRLHAAIGSLRDAAKLLRKEAIQQNVASEMDHEYTGLADLIDTIGDAGRGIIGGILEPEITPVAPTENGQESGSTSTSADTTDPGGPHGQSLKEYIDWILDEENWKWKTPINPKTGKGNNPGLDVDGNQAQCADIAKAWAEKIGKPSLFDGLDGPGSNKPGWTHIGGNTGTVQPGDVITQVGGGRHVVLVISEPDADGYFDVIEQNPDSPHKSRYKVGTPGVIWRP
jgi:hypothetical protein